MKSHAGQRVSIILLSLLNIQTADPSIILSITALSFVHMYVQSSISSSTLLRLVLMEVHGEEVQEVY